MKPNQKSGFWGLLPFVGAACWFLGNTGLCSVQIVPAPNRADTSQPAETRNDAEQAELPAWTALEKTAQTALSQNKDYQPGDLITREEATGVFAALKKAGWQVKKSKDLTERLLPASDEMVRQLRSLQGKKFMRNINGFSGGFDRLDRLRKLPNGSKRLREFIQQPEGHKLIEYMATTPGGKHMGRELSSKKHGDFNAPTKRIYTDKELFAELRTLHAADSAAASKKLSSPKPGEQSPPQ